MRVAAMTTLQLVVISVLAATAGVGAFLDGVMLPDNPVVLPGSALVLNCTLLKHDLNLTSNDLFFMKAQTKINQNYTKILDEWTAQLTIPNVSVEFHKKVVICFAGDEQKRTLMGMQLVVVIQKPLKPRITKCLIRDSAMTCSWSPTGTEQGERIKLKVLDELSWKLEGTGNDTWRPCPNPGTGTCEWPKLNDTSAVYMIKIFTYYAHDSVTVNFKVNASTIIQVEQIKFATQTHLSATSLKLEWPWVKETADVVYRVNLSHPTFGFSNMSRLVYSNETTLDGLTPFQPYDFSIEAKTKLGGYWSQPYLTQFFSRSDVPARNPEVKIGAFTVTEKVGDPCVEATLYWQTLSLKDQHGPDFTYAVNWTDVNGCTIPCDSRDKAESHVKLVISKNCTVDVTVTSVNVNGTSLAEKTPVRIEPTSQRIPGPSNITVITSNDTVVVVSWNSEPNNTQTTGYSVYWCHSLRHACKNQIEWLSVTADTNRVVLNLPEKFDKYEFAVSREEGKRSSGMVLSDCTYQDGKYSPPPGDFIISESGYGELALEWKSPQCSIHRGFVYGYELAYCQTQEEEGCAADSHLEKVYICSTETKVVLTDLTEYTRYCVTIRSLTAKGPSRWDDGPQCAVIAGPWWTTGRIVGFAIGGVLVLALVIFGIIRFWRHCHRLYSKFQQGIRVELPRTSYSTQFSVSSQRGLIDQNHSFSYNVEDFSTPGLAKQNSQESTADSGRGSMSQDHIHHPMRRSNSGESDEVFLGKLAPQGNGTSRSRQLSDSMANYVRVVGPEGHSGSALSLGNSTSERPKLPPRKIPLKDMSPGSASSSSHNFPSSSPTSGSIPSYVMVGEHSHPGGDSSSVKDNVSHCSGSYSSPMPDYIKAPGENSSLNYITPDNQNQEEYVVTPDIDSDNKALGYITSSEAANQGVPPGYVTSPEAANQRAPLGYITSPEAANQRAPLGYITSPEVANQGAPPGYVASPEAATQGAPSGYVASPEAANQGAPPGYIASPEAANQGAPPGYVASPEAANQGAAPGYITSPEAANQGAPPGYIASPEVANQGAPSGYVASPEAANQRAPSGYVSSPEAANQGAPSGYVAGPNVGGYVSHNALPSMERPSPQGYVETGTPVDPSSQKDITGISDYVSVDDIPPPLAVSTPNAYVSTDGSQAPPELLPPTNTATSTGTNKQLSSHDKPHMLQSPASSDNVSVTSKDSLPVLGQGVSKSPVSRSSDANHNDVRNTGSYVRPETMTGLGPPSETIPLDTSAEAQTEPAEDSDETSFLLPPDGGRKVLNKSGYVVIDT